MLGVRLSLVMRLSSFDILPSTGSAASAAARSPPTDSSTYASSVCAAYCDALVSNLGSYFSCLSFDPVNESGVISIPYDCSTLDSSADWPILASVVGLSFDAEIYGM